MKTNITITVSGTTCSGKTFIKHQIGKHLKSLGLDVEVEEFEMNEKAVSDRLSKPKRFTTALKEKNTKIKIEEKQLHRYETIKKN